MYVNFFFTLLWTSNFLSLSCLNPFNSYGWGGGHIFIQNKQLPIRILLHVGKPAVFFYN